MSKSEDKADDVESLSGLRAYFKNSREVQTSILLVIPLFVLYQLGVLLTGGVRNGVDFVTTLLLHITGNDFTLYLGVNLVVLLLLLAALFVLRRRGKLHPKVFPGVLVESTLMGGLFYFATTIGLPRVIAGTIALIASSLVFSAIHHTGSLGEAFAMGPFIFRFVAGMVLAAIFALRGFAVAVYTHAIYDIIVMVLKE